MKPVEQLDGSVHCGRETAFFFEPSGLHFTRTSASDQAGLARDVARLLTSGRLLQFIKFCIVGGTGVALDMTVLYLLADPRSLGWDLSLSKICAAGAAMTNNFIWNEVWTFRQSTGASGGRGPVFRRFLLFNVFCALGIGLAVLLLHLFHGRLGWNLYLSNLLSISLVTFWNFGMNARFNWRSRKEFYPAPVQGFRLGPKVRL